MKLIRFYHTQCDDTRTIVISFFETDKEIARVFIVYVKR